MFLFVSCSKDGNYSSYTYDDETIYSGSNKILLTEVVGFLSPYIIDNGEKKYVAADNLKNIEFKIHNKNWFLDSTYTVDTVYINNKETLGEYVVSSQEIKYPMVLNVRKLPENMETAGDYSEMINNYYVLPTGTYVLQIVSLDLVLRSGSVQKVYTPTLYTSLEVKDGNATANIGNFEVLIQK